MKAVSVSNFRSHLPEFIRMAKRGVPVSITSRGREVARLVPAQDLRAEARRQLAGLRKTAKIGDLVSPVLEDWDILK
jgi:prevent-host-death family protein